MMSLFGIKFKEFYQVYFLHNYIIVNHSIITDSFHELVNTRSNLNKDTAGANPYPVQIIDSWKGGYNAVHKHHLFTQPVHSGKRLYGFPQCHTPCT